MNYELSVKLEKSGFPNMKNHRNICGEDYIPTLSELIEACGPKKNGFSLASDRDWETRFF